MNSESNEPSNSEGSRNATEAPTSARTTEALAARLNSPGLDEEGLAFVNLLQQYYGMCGRIMPLAVAVSEYMFTEVEYLEHMSNPTVALALAERGVTVKPSEKALVKELVDQQKTNSESRTVGSSPSMVVLEVCETCGKPVGVTHDPDLPWQERTLSPIQLMVANCMLDLVDTRSQKKKLQDLGVSTSQYQMWLKDPVFSNYMKSSAQSMVGEQEHEVYLALLDKVRMGDSKAISMYLEMQGIYVPERGQNVGTTAMSDFKMLMIKILEIIQEEVPLEFQFSVGDRIRGLVGITDTANALIGTIDTSTHEVIQPHVKPARVLSPRLQELMDKGVGND